MSENKNKVNKVEARNALWRRGMLTWLLHPVQKEMYDVYTNAGKNNILVFLTSRQLGKSSLLTIVALEQALKKKNSIIKIVTDTKQHLRSIFDPLFVQFLETCPTDVMPKYHQAQFEYAFPNGSKIQLAGSDNKHYEKLRGMKADLVLVDEAGFCNDLESMVISVLLPTTTHTGGKIILASTPPEDPAHPFMSFMEEAQMNGNLIKKTIYDNPLLSKEQVDNIIQKMGGVSSERFRREYLAEIIKSPDSAVIPEFTEVLRLEIVKEWPLPPFFDTYVAMDLGFKDLTAILFGYYDFRADKVIIQDEMIVDFKKPDITIEKMARDIRQKEELLWTNPLTFEVKTPLRRVSDIDPMITNDIRKYSNNYLNFENANNKEPEAGVNNLRVMIANKKIIISPKCVTLIRHIENARWRSTTNIHGNKDFARSADNGHYDALSALVYFSRAIETSKNPYPYNYNMNMKDIFVVNPEQFKNPNKQIEIYKSIFNVKKKF